MSQTSSIQQTKNQVNQVIDVMKNNMVKVMERDDKVNDLAQRSEAMQMGAAQFQVQSRNLKKKYWWQNFKWWLIVIFVTIVVILLIVGLSVGFGGKDSAAAPPVTDSTPTTTTTTTLEPAS